MIADRLNRWQQACGAQRTKLQLKFGEHLAAAYRGRNHRRSRPRVLVYTDSRGSDVTRKHLRQYKFVSYPRDLIKRYVVDLIVMPHRHTTIADFLAECEPRFHHYDVVVCHAGVVDFAPRTQSSAWNDVYCLKRRRYDSIFPPTLIEQHIQTGYDTLYEGEETANMFSIEMARDYLLPRLRQYSHLIWIGSNRILEGWHGNFRRPRPENIRMLEDYSDLFCESLRRSVCLNHWTDREIQSYTYDNVHFTRNGEDYLTSQIVPMIEAIVSERSISDA